MQDQTKVQIDLLRNLKLAFEIDQKTFDENTIQHEFYAKIVNTIEGMVSLYDMTENGTKISEKIKVSNEMPFDSNYIDIIGPLINALKRGEITEESDEAAKNALEKISPTCLSGISITLNKNKEFFQLPQDLQKELLFNSILFDEFGFSMEMRNVVGGNKLSNLEMFDETDEQGTTSAQKLLAGIDYGLRFKDQLGVPQMTAKSWELLGRVREAVQKHIDNTELNEDEIALMKETPVLLAAIFGCQKTQHSVMTSCKDLKILGDYLKNNENISQDKRLAIIKTMVSTSKEIAEKLSRLKTDNEVQQVADYIQEVVNHGKQTIAECDPAKFILNNLNNNPQIKSETNKIGFYAAKILQKQGNLLGAANINIDEIIDTMSENPTDEQKDFLRKTLTVIKERAATEVKNADNWIGSATTAVLDIFWSVVYAIDMYVFMSREKRATINESSEWASYIEANKNDSAIEQSNSQNM